MKLPPPNARFWTRLNGGHVKLTLQPGQRLAWGHVWRDDEGWSSEFSAWEWDGAVLTQESGTDGTDCDGRLSTSYDSFCPLDKLRARQACDHVDLGWAQPIIEIPIPGVFYPEWTRGCQAQREYSAEAMNY